MARPSRYPIRKQLSLSDEQAERVARLAALWGETEPTTIRRVIARGLDVVAEELRELAAEIETNETPEETGT